MNNRKGFSLVELAIGLAVITILILAVSFSSSIRDTARIQSAVRSIEALRASAESYLISSNSLDYSTLSVAALKTLNLLPNNFDPSKANPFGGSFAIGSNIADKTHFDISLGSVNKVQATKLSDSFKNTANSAYDEGKGTWTATF